MQVLASDDAEHVQGIEMSRSIDEDALIAQRRFVQFALAMEFETSFEFLLDRDRIGGCHAWRDSLT